MSVTIRENLKPVKVYDNVVSQKLQIFKDNNKRAGIYMWKNNAMRKIYIGSAKDLGRRVSQYLSVLSLQTAVRKSRSIICSSLLKG